MGQIKVGAINFVATATQGKKEMKHYWNGDVAKWEKAFERLNRDIYFVMSYGESMGMKGFYECVDMIGRHPTWTLCIVTNLSFNPERLINSRLGQEKRVFLHPCWHPYGVKDRVAGWEIFKKHLLMLKEAGIPLHVLYLWWKPQIGLFPEYFRWLDAHDIRVNVRRFIETSGGFKLPLFGRKFGCKTALTNYTDAERSYLYANTCPKVTKYGLDLVHTTGKTCSAGMDMFLVKYNGDVAYCADLENNKCLGNIFSSDFKLSTKPAKCISTFCGGDYGMLHLIDKDFPANPTWLPNEPFLTIAEELKEGHPVPYPNRVEMLKLLEKIKSEQKNPTVSLVNGE